MKYAFTLVCIAFLMGCGSGPKKKEARQDPGQRVVKKEFGQIMDVVGVRGSVLIYDPQKRIYYSNNFQWAEKGFLPASTFKIVNSIIALETEVVENDSTLFPWHGEKRRLSVWERDMTFKDAFHLSCVPCYQGIARNVGVMLMKGYLTRFGYGHMIVDSSNIDTFWLDGESTISQMEQIDFLRKFYFSQLSISERTEQIMKSLMVISDKNNSRLSGKTGWSIRHGSHNGWFVGYLEKDLEVYFIATNINPKKNFDMDLFPVVRKGISMEALKVMGLWE